MKQEIIVYVLSGKAGKRYVGITNNLERRINVHRRKESKGSQVIGTFDLLKTESFEDYKSAREREKFLKSGVGRKYLDEYETLTRSAEGG
jgi:putative endonuclease